MKLLPGDHVAQKDLTDEQYHAIAKKFMEAGARQGEYGEIIRREAFPFFGWGLASNRLHHGSTNGKHSNYFDGRTLTPSQILEDDNGWFERGELPPVGSVAEFLGFAVDECAKHERQATGQHVKIECHFQAQGCIVAGFIFETDSGEIYISQAKASRFRPIKSDRDKVVEAAMDELKNLMTLPTLEYNKRIVEHLAKAGLLKLPEGESNAR